MTNEQLDEIEKLAEAATPGPWATEGESWEEVEGEDDYQPMPRPYTLTGPNDKAIWSSGGGEYAYPDNGTAAFIVAMRKYALPLVKAVRGAQKERDVLQAVLNDWQRFGMEREKERDEARAEVERLRSALRLLWEEADDEGRCQFEYAPGCYGHYISTPCREAVEAALKENR